MSGRKSSYRTAARLGHRLRRQGKKIVFTNGCFDILHAGHVDYLTRAHKLGQVLILGLNSDRSVRRIKGSGRPLNSQEDRARVLGGLRAVDYVLIFDEETPASLIQAVKPHVLVKGADWKLSEIAGRREVARWGGKVKRIPLLKGRSTTRLIRKVKKR